MRATELQDGRFAKIEGWAAVGGWIFVRGLLGCNQGSPLLFGERSCSWAQKEARLGASGKQWQLVLGSYCGSVDRSVTRRKTRLYAQTKPQPLQSRRIGQAWAAGCLGRAGLP